MPLACCHLCRKILMMDRAFPGERRFRTILSMPPRPASMRRSRVPASPPYSRGPKRRAFGCERGSRSLCRRILR